jgi:glycosyltransferase involved in cell wall biosynthesis
MPDPKISIVIPSYNQGIYIEQTITSILNQGYDAVELIIIDGGSKDNTVEIIKKYAGKISYWVSEPDRGQADAINKGLAHCTGEIFNWINSDDYLEPGALAVIGNAFAANRNTDVVCGYTRCFYNEDNSTSHEYRMGIKNTAAETIAFVEMNQPGSFYRTAVVKELGGVNESLRYVFDDELWFRYLCKYGLAHIHLSNARLAQFRLHKASKSVGEGFDEFAKELQVLYADILAGANAPAWLMEQMTKEGKGKYISAGKWNIDQLEVNKFIAAFAVRYINTLYLAGNKKAMQLAVENGFYKWNRMLMSLRIKLMLS